MYLICNCPLSIALLSFVLKMIQKVRDHPEFEGQVVGNKPVYPLAIELESQRNYGSICIDGTSLSSFTASQTWVMVAIFLAFIILTLVLYYTGNGDLLLAILVYIECKFFGVGCQVSELSNLFKS